MRIIVSRKHRRSYGYGLFFIAAGAFMLQSCVTNEKVTYLQDYEESRHPIGDVVPETYRIQPNDNLYIQVSTPDPTISAIFNVMTDGGSNMRVDEASANIMSYPVLQTGDVVLPYIGSVHVAGKTLPEAKDIFEEELADYVSDVSITVRLVNNYVSILGEVNVPGMYPIYKQRLNIFQALAMAGDMGEYSDRYHVKVIRQTLEGSVISEFDLTDKKIVDSEFYYVMPNDVIIASPMKGKFFRMNEFPASLIFSTITTTVSVFLLIQNLILLQGQ